MSVSVFVCVLANSMGRLYSSKEWNIERVDHKYPMTSSKLRLLVHLYLFEKVINVISQCLVCLIVLVCEHESECVSVYIRACVSNCPKKEDRADVFFFI